MSQRPLVLFSAARTLSAKAGSGGQRPPRQVLITRERYALPRSRLSRRSSSFAGISSAPSAPCSARTAAAVAPPSQPWRPALVSPAPAASTRYELTVEHCARCAPRQMHTARAAGTRAEGRGRARKNPSTASADDTMMIVILY